MAHSDFVFAELDVEMLVVDGLRRAQVGFPSGAEAPNVLVLLLRE